MVVRILTVLAFAIMFHVPANAQMEGRLEVDVPFQFVAGSTQMPAGRYTIKQVNPTNAYVIASSDGKHAEIVMTSQRLATNAHKQAAVHFRRYGNKHFLAQMLVQGDNIILQVAKSRAEKAIEASGNPHSAPDTVVVGAN